MSENKIEHKYKEIETMEQWKDIVKDSNENSHKIIIDFYAPWCRPCKNIAPLFAKASDHYTNIKFYKINIENKELSSVVKILEVKGLPTFLVAEGDDEVDRLVGGSPNKFVELVKKHGDEQK